MISVELLAPAGNFKTALHALGAGADAVYCGLKEFSARAGADNLTMEEVRRLKAFAVKSGKRIYVTLNTVITQAELPRLRSIITELALVQVDAVIIQDFGVLELLRAEAPNLAIHISTQMAVHNACGARLLSELGAARIVLAREMTFNEIAQIRHSLPELPLEVFCHGALCYSFSGLCLASGLMLGRSANRGRCAQVCRTYFQQGGSQECGYFFSMNDLALYERVLQLAQLGVASLKIEGRMKDPLYVTSVIKLYRAILDQAASGTAQLDIAELKAAARLTFARTPTVAYADNPRGERLVGTRYPSHMGLSAGKILHTAGARLTLASTLTLQLHDRLLFLPPNATRAANKMKEAGGRIVFMLNAQNQRCKQSPPSAFLQIDIAGEFPSADGAGWEVFLVGRDEAASTALAGIDLKQFPLATLPLSLQIEIDDTTITLCSTAALPGGKIVKISVQATVEGATAQHETLHGRLLTLLAQSGSSLYRVTELTLINRSSHERPFLPPSVWKSAKNQFYAAVADTLATTLSVRDLPPPVAPLPLNLERDPWLAAASARSQLNPLSGSHGRRIPFLMPSAPLTLASLGRLGPWYVIPLLPVLFAPEPYFARIAALIAAHSEERFLIGLNNIGHLAPCLMQLAPNANVSFFLDVHLYIASTAAYAFFAARLPRITFFYQWVEDDSCCLPGGVALSDPSRLAYFISRCCFQRHASSSCGECTPGCTGSHGESLSNAGRSFDLVTEDCLSFLLAR